MGKSNKWLKPAASVALSVALLSPAYAQAASPNGAASADAWRDIQGHWAQASIQKWIDSGLISGYPDHTFRPGSDITRAEFASMINKIFGFSATSASAFADVPSSAWYANALAIAKEAGYYNGFPGNLAKPNEAITRQDAIVLLAKAFELANQEGASNLPFADKDQIKAYAADAVKALSSLISGYEDGTFRPNGHITRAELVSLIDKLVVSYYSAPGTYSGGQINGNVVINSAGVVLNGAAIAGNLYLAPGIGAGDVTLNGVTVQGKVMILGGNPTVIASDSNLKDVRLEGKGGKGILRTSGSTRIGSLTVDSAAGLELGGQTSVDSANLNQPATLDLAKDASIASLTIATSAGGTAITGSGSIGFASSQASGVTVNGTTVGAGSFAVSGGVASGSGTSGTGGTSSGGSSGGGGSGPVQTAAVDLVDTNATAWTKSLFVYLNESRGHHILFGQQHATDEGLSITTHDGTQSDTYNDVGAYPALFGWDTLSLEGKEKPGVAGNYEQSRDNLVASMKKAYAFGGVLTLSSHLPNFVTGGDFYDTKGNVVSHILPGGDKNAEYNDFLDKIADFANRLKTDDGTPIPVIYRPFHEQNGSWFWWGAAFTTTDEYKEIYRYTVEYLRDKKGVHNFLYAFSPGGGFGTSADTYLKTYPGDDYVDILGFDSYYNGEGDSWFAGVKTEAATVSKIADSKHKVAALTEFGYQGMKVSGNATTDFYTRLANALKSDPDARKMAYMLTWANFGPDSVYVPFHTGDPAREHEMLPDFIDFYNDPYTTFSNGVSGAYSKTVNTSAESGFMHIASPTDQGTVRDNVTVIRARVLNESPARVVYSVGSSGAEAPMTYDANSGYYTANWTPAADLNGTMTTVTVKVYGANDQVLQQQTNTVFVKVGEILIGQYTFDSPDGLNGVQYNGEYSNTLQSTNNGSIEYSDFNGGSLRINTSQLVNGDTWQELKLELKNAKDVAGGMLDNVKRVKMDVYIPVDMAVYGDKFSVRAVGQLPPDWSTKYGMDTTYTSLANLEQVSVAGTTYLKFSPTIDFMDSDKLQAADDIALSVVGSGWDTGSATIPVFVDNIRLYSVYAEAAADPALVDDFESYLGSNDALGAKFVHAGGDNATAVLDGGSKHAGSYGMKYTYTLDTNGYAGVTKALNGVDWSGFNALQFWYQPDGQGQKLVMQVNVGGKTYEYYPDTQTTTAAFITAPFNQFVPANGATGTLTKTNLKNVQAFSIYTNAVPNGNKLTSSMYFDDIRAVNDPSAGTVPNGSSGGGVATGVLFDFESSIAGWSLNDNSLGAANVANPAVSGGKALSADFPGTSSGSGPHFELTNMSDLDLSNGHTLKLKASVSAGTAKAKLFVKHGSGWAWADGGEVTLTTGDQWLTLDLDNAQDANGHSIDKTNIRAIGVQIYSPNGAGTMTVYLDDVTLE